ncbi:MAG: Tat pathway signal protein [Campylobacteraceae bacterium]|nr:Tat pathway signal protein [Campylobacteraceae bacterium]
MQEQRRVFLKSALGAGAVAAVAAVSLAAKEGKSSENGVVVGKSKKKEILYRRTKEWDTYYKRSY